ncbi:MAG: arginine--tRNA ligase [Alphaproteobacteria bacterium]
MPSLTAALTEIVSAAFAAAGLPAALGVVTVSARPDLGQFQCNGALAAAKVAKAPPRKLAESVAARLKDNPVFADVALAGPGFINLTLTGDHIAAHVNALAADSRFGVPASAAPATVVLDFGGPNIAKPMHVGHLRAAIIGDCLQRLFRFVGDHVVSDVHMGDWGLPMGMLIAEIALNQPDLVYFDARSDGPYPTDPPVSMDELERLYPAAAAACKADPARLEAARAATAELQRHRPGYQALWRHFMDVSVAGMRQDFASLGVRFDLWKGEADVHDLIAPMVERLTANGAAQQSEGALVIAVVEPDDKTELPPLILLKSDGGAMYGTTDLATIVDRVQTHDPDLMLYVVDQRQHLHFEQVFRAARKTGLNGRAALEHIGFGTVNGTDGKPFKTRTGGVMKLQDLIGMATEQALVRLREAGLAADYPEEERREIARMVGIAAIKFADLGNHRMSNYVFDLDRFTRFEGRTGPYLQYAAVRIKSLLRKAEAQGAASGAILPPTEVEHDLMLTLCQLPDAVAAAHGKRTPNDLCDFAFRLAQEFSRFYAACHILSETDGAVQGSRLALARLTLHQFELVLSLLGIEVPERM